nr:NUDIX domain-containing protein [Amycolatopsis sp. RTGN1]
MTIDREPALRVGARVLLLNRDDEVLLIHTRDPDDPSHHWWELPGGGQDPGEKLEDTARREIAEETGLVVDQIGRKLWTRESRFTYGVERVQQANIAQPGNHPVSCRTRRHRQPEATFARGVQIRHDAGTRPFVLEQRDDPRLHRQPGRPKIELVLPTAEQGEHRSLGVLRSEHSVPCRRRNFSTMLPERLLPRAQRRGLGVDQQAIEIEEQRTREHPVHSPQEPLIWRRPVRPMSRRSRRRCRQNSVLIDPNVRSTTALSVDVRAGNDGTGATSSNPTSDASLNSRCRDAS